MRFLKTPHVVALIGILVLLSGACSDEPSLGSSALNTNPPQLTVLDQWLRDEFTTPYNIEVEYRWNENEVDLSRFLFPPTPNRVQPAMELVRNLWVNPYNEVRPGMIKEYAARLFVLVGGSNINSHGRTRVLGSAEGGKKVVLYEIDFLNVKNVDEVTRFVSTIQHEYAHILNQSIPFDEATYENVTKKISNYRSDWADFDIAEARDDGFITPYASSSVVEDFAEMVNVMLSNSKTQFDAIIKAVDNVAKSITEESTDAEKKDAASAPLSQAAATLRAKENLVVNYYKSAFDIDFYRLQEKVTQAREKIQN